MPATGTPVPDGLGFNESLQLIKSLIEVEKYLDLMLLNFHQLKIFLHMTLQ